MIPEQILAAYALKNKISLPESKIVFTKLAQSLDASKDSFFIFILTIRLLRDHFFKDSRPVISSWLN